MYPNPYMTNMASMAKPGLLASLKNISWGGILDGTQKTLGVINQAIPIVYQVKPMVSNMRSLLRIANEITSPEVPETRNSTSNAQTIQEKTSNYNNSKPVFFIQE